MFRLPRASSTLAFGLSLFFTLGTASAVDIPGDFNGDGLADVLQQPLDGTSGGAIVLQDSTGQLTIVSQTWAAGYLGIDWAASDTKLTAADLNGDRYDDVVVQPVEPGSPAAVLLMNGSSQLQQVSQVVPANFLGLDWSSTIHQVVVGDFDGDGRKELFMQATNPGDASYVVHADINGQLSALSQPVSGQTAIVDGYLNRRWNAQDVTLYVGDFNGDGRQDLLMQVNPGAPDASESDYALLLADGNGQFTGVAETWNNDAMGENWDPSTHKIVVEDVNGDHIMDIVVESDDPNGTSFVMLGNTQGSLTQASAHWTGTKSAVQIAALLPVNGSSTTVDTSDPSQIQTIAQNLRARASATNANPSDAAGSGTIRTANAVGTLQGSGGVSGGTATYNIPITLPPGIAGMQPSVSLGYSSRGGNGEMGMGWSLRAGSEIHRCPGIKATNGYSMGVTYGATDRLCLDGQRLIRMIGTGSGYGTDGAKYRTEQDSYSLITEHGDITSSQSYFTVNTKDNHTLRYGFGTNIAGSSNAVLTPTGVTAPLAWDLGIELDQASNSVIYYYSTFGAGEHLLTSIKYTGYGSAAGDREVDFTYNTRGDMSNQYLAGGLTSQTQILSSISVTASGTPVRQYNMEYQASRSSGRSMLTAVQECAGSGSSLACLPVTTFNWQASTNSFQSASNIDPADFGSSTTTMMSNIANQASLSAPGDFDGDGRKDLLYTRAETGAKVFFLDSAGNVKGGSGVDITNKGFNSYMGLIAADIDGDGASELLGPYSPGDGSGIAQFGYIKFNGSDSAPNFSNVHSLGIPYSSHYSDGTGSYGTIVTVTDVDGDGRPDIVAVIQSPQSSTTHMLVYYPNTTAACTQPCQPTPAFGAPVTIFSVADYSTRSILTAMAAGDLDGNGLPDFAVNYIDSAGTGHNITIFTNEDVNGNVSFVSSNLDTWTALSGTTIGTSSSQQLADVNGDGLPDLVKACTGNSDFCYELNTGKQGVNLFGPIVDSGATGGIPTGAVEGDFDNDGRNEFIWPVTLLADYCVDYTNVMVGGEPESVPNVCATDQSTWVPGVSPPNDYGIYKYDLVKFVPVSDGNGGVLYQPSNKATGIIGQKGLTVAFDLQGDGLTDVIAPFSNWFQYGHFKKEDASYTAIRGMSIESSTNGCSYGSTAVMQCEQDAGQDMVIKATDGFGVAAQWDYYPLAAGACNGTTNPCDNTFGGVKYNGLPLYFVPDQATTNRYTGGGDYFYFASSMYVVGDYKTSDGIGGMVEHDFHYGQAIYNNQGRGFQGFRTVVDDDTLHGSRTVQVYHQKFPLSGELQESWITPLAHSVDLTNPQADGSAVDHLQNTVACAQASLHSVMSVDGVTCATSITTVNNFAVMPLSSVETKFDLSTGSKLSTTTTHYCNLTSDHSACTDPSVPGYDQFGNLLGSITTVTDSEGTYTTSVANAYSYTQAETTDWWIDQLSSKIVSNDAVYGTAADAGLISRETDYTYNGDRQVATTTILAGTPYSVTTTYGYLNSGGIDRGNVTSVTVSGGDFASRTAKTDWGASGNYFPGTATNALGQSATTTSDERFGEPLTVTDANGVTTTYTYDAFGRKATAQVASLPQQTIQYVAADSNCPANAVYYTLTLQAGSASQMTCYDMFNRAVRGATDGFGSNETIYQDTQYDGFGRVTSVTEPYFAGDTGTHPSNTTRYMFDMLGRVSEKVDAKGVVTDYDYNPASDISQNGYLRPMTDITTSTPGDPLDSGYVRVDEEIHNTAGKMISVTNAVHAAEQAGTAYGYDRDGNPTLIIAADDSPTHPDRIVATYDLAGHKTKVVDPDQGTTDYTYDALGELKSQTDASAHTLNMTYDLLGRLRTKSSNAPGEGLTTWCYDVAANSDGTCPQDGSSATQTNTAPYVGKQSAVLQAADGFMETYTYDSLGRPTRVSDFTGPDSPSNDTDTTYNALGQVDTVTYPAAVADNAPQITSLTTSHFVPPNTPVTLTAAVTPGNGPQAVEYVWTQTSGPAVSLSSTSGLSTSFTTGPAPGAVYTFRFQTDDGLSATTGNVSIMVPPLPTVTPNGPIADNGTGNYNVTWVATPVAGDSPVYTLQEATSATATAPGDSAYRTIGSNIPQSTSSQAVSHTDNASYYYWYRLWGTGMSGQGPTSTPAMMHLVVKPGNISSISTSSTFTYTGVNYTVSWSSFSGSVQVSKVFYELYESNSSSFSSQTLVYSGSNRSKVMNHGVNQNGTYYYRVRACNQNDGVERCGGYESGAVIQIFQYNGGTGCPPPPQQCQLVLNDDLAVIAPVEEPIPAPPGEVAADERRAVPVRRHVRPRYALPVYMAWADAHLEDATTQISLGRFSVHYVYSATGYLQQIQNGVRSSDVYWTAGDLNARGQLLTEQYGSNLTSTHTYDPASGFEQEVASTTGATTVQDLHMDWYQTGNLHGRSATVNAGGTSYNPSETFSYDLHNRVLSSQVSNDQGAQTAVTYAYDSVGDITCKSDVVGHDCTTNATGYSYGVGAGPHALTSAGSHTYGYDPNGNMQTRDGNTITWNSDNLPTQITQGTESTSLSYAPDKHRYKQQTMGSNPETTYYFGAQEVVEGTTTDFRHTITAYGKPVFQMTLSADANGNPVMTPHYLLTDHLGSVDTVVDGSGDVEPRESFDAFGGRRDAKSWHGAMNSTDLSNARKVTHHGFTHHEQLDNVGLVHMNGRLEDPAVGRMLSVDPVYQAPTNSQSVNPYSYVMNNPMSLVDPSGYAAAASPLESTENENGDSGPKATSIETMQEGDSIEKLSDGTAVLVDAQGNYIMTVSNISVTTADGGTVSLTQNSGGHWDVTVSSGSGTQTVSSDTNSAQSRPATSADIGGSAAVSKQTAGQANGGSESTLADTGSESGKPLTAEQRQQTEAAAEADLKAKGLMGDHKVDYKNDYASVRTNKDGSVDKSSLQFFRTKTEADRDAVIHADTHGAPIEGLTGKGEKTSLVFAGAVAPGSIMNSHGVPVPMDAQLHTEFVIMHEFAHGNGIVDEHAADVDAMQKLGLW